MLSQFQSLPKFLTAFEATRNRLRETITTEVNEDGSRNEVGDPRLSHHSVDSPTDAIGRHVKIEQTDKHDLFWSIHDLQAAGLRAACGKMPQQGCQVCEPIALLLRQLLDSWP